MANKQLVNPRTLQSHAGHERGPEEAKQVNGLKLPAANEFASILDDEFPELTKPDFKEAGKKHGVDQGRLTKSGRSWNAIYKLILT